MFTLSSVEVGLLFKACVALVLFTSSVIAEIVRGGLNAVPHGQFETGHSQGFNTVQIMVYIVLPQAYRSVIPTLLVDDADVEAVVAALTGGGKETSNL